MVTVMSLLVLSEEGLPPLMGAKVEAELCVIPEEL